MASPSWIVVLDEDEVSLEQLRVCQALRPNPLRGAIRCDAPENADAPICSAVDFFPAFCEEGSHKCVYGLRRTREELEALATLPVQASPPAAAPADGA